MEPMRFGNAVEILFLEWLNDLALEEFGDELPTFTCPKRSCEGECSAGVSAASNDHGLEVQVEYLCQKCGQRYNADDLVLDSQDREFENLKNLKKIETV